MIRIGGIKDAKRYLVGRTIVDVVGERVELNGYIPAEGEKGKGFHLSRIIFDDGSWIMLDTAEMECEYATIVHRFPKGDVDGT